MAILLLSTLLSSVFLSPAIAAAAGGPATNPVYKCAGASSSVIYQDEPCAPGKELRNFATDPPALSVIPGTPVPGAPAASRAVAKSEHTTTTSRSRTAAGNTAKASERRYIKVGMTTAEVVQRIGKPDVDARNQKGKGYRWSYLPRDDDPNTITTVTLVDGRVADVERKLVR